jgi:ABC-2 type transport system permease protein
LIFAIVRTSIAALRRDRPSLALSFLLPIAFFSIFASVFGGQHGSTPKVKLIVVDEDQSTASRQLVQALKRESSLVVSTQSESKDKAAQTYTAATAEAAVKAGDCPVALIVPRDFGKHPVSFGSAQSGSQIQLLNDSSDMIAPQVVSGLLQKAAMTAMPSTMAEQGAQYTGKYIGGFTPEQQKRMDENMAQLRKYADAQAGGGANGVNGSGGTGAADSGFGGIIAVQSRAVVGENKRSPMISFYAAAIGVMFLLFTASGSAGALLDEAESGTLDRVLSSHVTMTTLLGGKLVFNSMLAFTQLVVMFLWAWAVFRLDFFEHIPGFVVMGLCTAFAVASFGMLLASMCHTRAQLGAVSTLLILTMSAVGGSMFPRFLMPPAMQTAGLFTINGWAIDGFTKVFWRDLPVTTLWPQVAVLLGIGTTLFLIARRIACRWEFA